MKRIMNHSFLEKENYKLVNDEQNEFRQKGSIANLISSITHLQHKSFDLHLVFLKDSTPYGI